MSIRGITTAAVAAEVEATARAAAPPPAPSALNATIASGLRRVATYIPSEALATYITLVALVDPDTFPPRWIIAGVGALLVIYLLWVGFPAERREQQPAGTKPGQWVKTAVISLVAFVVYVAAIPGTPFLDFSWFDLQIGGAAVVVAAVVLPGLAKMLGVAPSSSA